MKIIKTFVLVFIVGLFLSGCGITTQKATPDIMVEKTGEIKTKSVDEYIMMVGSDFVNIASYKVNLDNYMKKKVTVKGSFSGTTLYVSEIKE